MVVATVEDANRCVLEIGKFSGPLQDILAYVLKDLTCLKTDFKKENEARKSELAEKLKQMEEKLEQDRDRLKEIVKRKVVAAVPRQPSICLPMPRGSLFLKATKPSYTLYTTGAPLTKLKKGSVVGK